MKNSVSFNSKISFNKKYTQQFTKNLKKTNALLNGKLLPYLPFPIIWKENDLKNFNTNLSPLFSILKKIYSNYFKDKKIRDYYDFPKLLEYLIKHKPLCNHIAPVMRLDVIYHSPEKFKICEINTDGSSGMNESQHLEDSFFKTDIGIELSKKTSFHKFDYFKPLVKKLKQEYGKTQKKQPKTAIILDWENVSTIEEFKTFKKKFIQNSIKTYIVSPEKLKYKNKKLTYRNIPIDLCYRRLVTQEIINNENKLKPFFNAYSNDSIYCAGSFRTEILHSKIIFSLMHSKKFNYLFNDKEIKFIKNHIPYTAKTNEIGSIKKFINSKKQYILKPHNLYGGAGIIAGKETSDNIWKNQLNEFKSNKNYLIQKFYPPAKINLNNKNYKFLPAFFFYFNKFNGIYSRVSKTDIITTNLGGKVVPNIIFQDK